MDSAAADAAIILTDFSRALMAEVLAAAAVLEAAERSDILALAARDMPAASSRILVGRAASELLERMQADYSAPVPKDPARPCCAYCGASRRLIDDGYGTRTCIDEDGCLRRHDRGRRVQPLPGAARFLKRQAADYAADVDELERAKARPPDGQPVQQPQPAPAFDPWGHTLGARRSNMILAGHPAFLHAGHPAFGYARRTAPPQPAPQAEMGHAEPSPRRNRPRVLRSRYRGPVRPRKR